MTTWNCNPVTRWSSLWSRTSVTESTQLSACANSCKWIAGCVICWVSDNSSVEYFEEKKKKSAYFRTCNIKGTVVSNKLVDHSGVVGAAPVGASPTTSSFSTDEMRIIRVFVFGAAYTRSLTVTILVSQLELTHWSYVFLALTHRSAVMVLIMLDKQVLVFHDEGFKLPAPSQG